VVWSWKKGKGTHSTARAALLALAFNAFTTLGTFRVMAIDWDGNSGLHIDCFGVKEFDVMMIAFLGACVLA
jgi:hypothetical protein